MYYHNNELPPQQGWICPKCGRVNAPWLPTCGCVSRQTSGTPYLVKTSSISRESHEIAKDEPQTDIHDLTDCDFCKDRNCKDCEGGKDEPQTEPLQTCSVNGRPYSECSSCEHFRCTADEPHIVGKHADVIIIDESQADVEIAKAIVHKMIDDAVIAEDAYPDLRQKMHDAVDEYEPQTERSE